MKLYEIEQRIESVLELMSAVEVDSEAFEQLENEFDKLNMERDQKLSNCHGLLINWTVEIEAIRNEEKRLAAKRKARESQLERLKRYVMHYGVMPGDKWSKDGKSFSYRVSQSVHIVADIEDLPEEYQRVTMSADKAGLTTALKHGEAIEGVELVQKQNLQVK